MKPVTADEIKMTEKILLPEGETFGGEGSERVKVIQEMNESCDVVACPGSGKTTVLLAKLLILANRMPFEDNRGICVLTHTNVAIDEIKRKAGIAGDKLFNYPNFFGTFQKFVDKFLAIPYNSSEYGNRLNKIGREHYLNECKKFFYNLDWSTHGEYSLRNSLYHEFKYRKDLIGNGKDLEAFKMFCDLRIDFLEKKITKGINGKTFRKADTNSENALKAYKEIIEFKENLFIKGIADFDDCYSLALAYIDRKSKLSETFVSRFKYVFIDEMQDTDSHQLKIIENLFKNKNTKTIIQYFGDPNQSIYDFSVKKENVWQPGKDGRNKLPIPDSKRFGSEISSILDKLKIDGSINLKSDSTNNTLKPHLLVYKQGKENKVLEKFVEIIHNNQNKWAEDLKGKTPVYKAIGWVAKERAKEEINDGKLNISSYYPGFEKKSVKNKQVFDNLKFYLRKNNEAAKEKGAKIYYDSIINALLEVLDRGGVKRQVVNIKQEGDETKLNRQERHYTKTSLFKVLESKDEFKCLLNKIACWSNEIYSSPEDYNSETIENVRRYIKKYILKIFGDINESKVNEFINEPIEVSRRDNTEDIENKGYIFKSQNPEYKNIPIEVGTVHSVKGETHTATLYMETFFNKKYEIQRIKEILSGVKTLKHYLNEIELVKEEIKALNGAKGTKTKKKKLTSLQNKYNEIKMTLKMVHVGFSRPTHLLCFAVREDRININEIDKDKDEWKIIEA
jgi:hypothetical protein